MEFVITLDTTNHFPQKYNEKNKSKMAERILGRSPNKIREKSHVTLGTQIYYKNIEYL